MPKDFVDATLEENMLEIVNSDSQVIARNIFNVTGKSYITEIYYLGIILGSL